MKVTLTIAFAAIAAIELAAAQSNSEHELYNFTMFKTQFQKHYKSNKEEDRRREAYLENCDIISQHNPKLPDCFLHEIVGMNKYGDLPIKEIQQKMNGARPPGHNVTSASTPRTLSTRVVSSLPPAVDWRPYGYVTTVKDQGQCGSCWSFSATGALEGQNFRKSGRLTSLSEQNLVDCTRKYGCMGCGGGWMNYAFNYVRNNPGVDTESSYPYTANNGGCKFSKSSIGSYCSGYTVVPKGDEYALQVAVANVGPISVAIDASYTSFQLYRSGVYYERNCSSSVLDHGVLVVGYGTSNASEDYWIVKNS